MERIGKEAAEQALGKVLQSSDSVSLTKHSGISPQDGMACLLLLKQTKDRYINQQLPETTEEMYLVEWEEMAQRFGLKEFADGLSRAIRRSKFFPDPTDIREECEEARRDVAAQMRAKRATSQMLEWKAQWEAERISTSS